MREEGVDGEGAESVVNGARAEKGSGGGGGGETEREKEREEKQGGEIGGVSGLSRPRMESKRQRVAQAGKVRSRVLKKQLLPKVKYLALNIEWMEALVKTTTRECNRGTKLHQIPQVTLYSDARKSDRCIIDFDLICLTLK